MRLPCATTLILALVFMEGAGAAFDFSLRIPGQLEIVEEGVVNGLVATATSVSALPIPYEVTEVAMVWRGGAAPNYTIATEVVVGGTAADLSAAYSVPASGRVPTSSAPISVRFTCFGTGQYTVKTTISLSNATASDRLEYFFTKDCNPEVGACAPCGECIDQGACECLAGDRGTVCSRLPPSGAEEAVESVDSIKVISYNTYGVGLVETNDQLLARYQKIAAAVDPYDIVCLQEVWNSEARNVLVNALRPSHPFISDKTFGDGPNKESGLFFASKFPILRQSYQEFDQVVPGSPDALTDKGVYGALVRLRENFLIYAFNTHMQAGPTADVAAAQLAQIRTFVDFEVENVATTIPLQDIAVLLFGDLNIDGLGDDGAFSAVEIGETLGAERDLVGESVGGDAAALRTTGYRGPCTAAIAAFANCTVGSDVDVGARLDYIWAWTAIGGRKTRNPVVLDAQNNAFATDDAPAYPPLFGQLSDHKAVEATLDTDGSPPVYAIVLPVVAAVLFLAVVAALVFHVYVRKRPLPLPPFVRAYLRQVRALMAKNLLVTLRNKRALALQLLVPFLFVGALFALQFALASNQRRQELIAVRLTSEPEAPAPLSRCHPPPGGDGTCVTIGYTPDDDAFVAGIIRSIAAANGIPDSEVRGFASQDEADAFLAATRNYTQGIYHVNPTYTATGELLHLNYTIQFNQTVRFVRRFRSDPVAEFLVPMQLAFEKAVLDFQARNLSVSPGFDLDVTQAPYPHPEIVTVDVIATSGPPFFLACLMFNFVIQLGQVVMEKELRLREAMAVVGLRNSVYWLTWLFTNMLWNTVSSLLLMAAGAMFQFDFFLKNDFGTYFFLFLLFGLAMVPLALLLSVFLARSSSATSVGFALFLVGVIAQGTVDLVYDEGTWPWVQTLVSFLPFMLLAKGMVDLGAKSDNVADTGLRWAERSSYGYFPIGDVFLWLLLDFAVFSFLTVFLDFWFGGTTGESRFRRLLSGKKASSRDTERANRVARDSDVEEEEARVKGGGSEAAVVQLMGLRKTYYNYKYGCVHQKGADFTAVDGLWLEMEGKQLYCLLGHNGAGKSTTISILTGLVQSTGGDVRILGKGLDSNVAAIREEIGVCPQFDVLWAELTGEEHLRLFGALKGVPEDILETEVAERLADVELTHAATVNSGAYSGGMKRRLSVAIAFTGDPKVAYLDEPTTGMDPVSRRQVWSLLEREKRKRLVVLTTHSMEEADMLGDKIAIMKKGQFCCMGTPLHLKQRFGNGYRLTVAADPERVADARDYVDATLPGAVLSRDEPGTLHFEAQDDDNLPTFLKKAEKEGKNHGIVDIQVGMTSLEDVFLSVAGLSSEASSDDEQGEGEDSENIDTAAPTNLQFNRVGQAKALFSKTLLVQRRQYLTNIAQVSLPLVMILVLFVFQLLVTSIIQDELGKVRPADPNPALVPSFFLVAAPFDTAAECPGADDPVAPVVFDKGSGEMLIVGPDIMGAYGPPADPSSFWRGAGGATNSSETPFGLLGNVTRNVVDMLAIKGQAYPRQGNRRVFCLKRPYITPVSFDRQQSKADMEEVLFADYGTTARPGSYIVGAAERARLAFTVYFNATLTAGQDLPRLINLLTDAAFRQTTAPRTAPPGEGQPPPGMALSGTRSFPVEEGINDFDLISLIGPFIYIFLLQLLFPVILGNLVYEKEYKLREIMKMMGLKTEVYWLVNHVVFLLMFLVAAGCMWALAAALGFNYFLRNDASVLIVFFFLWGNVMVASAFLAQAFFTRGKTATIVGYVYVFASGIISTQLIRSYFDQEDTPYGIIFIVCLFPPFTLFRGLYDLRFSVQNDGPGLSMGELANDGVAMDEVLIFLAVEFVVLMLAAAYVEMVFPSGVGLHHHPLFFLKKSWWAGEKGTAAKRPPLDGEAKDVMAERERTWASADDPIRMLDLHKVYPGSRGNPDKVAVANLTMGVKKGECFGMLGPNGSGKSTTVNMLCGYFPPTSGTATIAGLDVQQSTDLVHLQMGVCPQDNIIWPQLTGLEHMRFYGKIKNLSGGELDKQVKRRLLEVDLWGARNKQAGRYSGGMKRRLCVAMALIGDAAAVLLDEPSTGLDPKAKTSLWTVIRDAKKHSAVLLTTHSMEESEALCERVGIVVNGVLRTVGTPALLKYNFGEFFKLAVTVATDDDEGELHKRVVNLCPTAEVFNRPVRGSVSYKLPRGDTKLSAVFSSMRQWEGDADLSILDWGVSSITLEEVFLQIAMDGGDLPTALAVGNPSKKAWDGETDSYEGPSDEDGGNAARNGDDYSEEGYYTSSDSKGRGDVKELQESGSGTYAFSSYSYVYPATLSS